MSLLKKLKIKKDLFLLLALLLPTGLQAWPGEDVELKREETRTFELAPGSTLDLRNQYGYIKVEQGGGKTAEIKVTIIAKGKDEEAAKKTLDRIDADFALEGNYLTVQTLFDKSESKMTGLLRNIADFSKNLFSEGNLQINYSLRVPAGIKLVLTHKNGNITLGDLDCQVQADLQDGHLAAEKLQADCRIVLGASSASIKEMGYGFFELKTSTLQVEKLEKADIHSNLAGSTINIITAGEVYLDTQNDQIELKEVKSVTGKSSLSKITVGQLQERGTLEVSFGSLQIQQVASDFTDLLVTSKSADVDIKFHEKAVFKADIEAKADKLEMPQWSLKKTWLDENRKTVKYSGVAGAAKAESASSRFTLRASSGSITLKN